MSQIVRHVTARCRCYVAKWPTDIVGAIGTCKIPDLSTAHIHRPSTMAIDVMRAAFVNHQPDDCHLSTKSGKFAKTQEPGSKVVDFPGNCNALEPLCCLFLNALGSYLYIYWGLSAPPTSLKPRMAPTWAYLAATPLHCSTPGQKEEYLAESGCASSRRTLYKAEVDLYIAA